MKDDEYKATKMTVTFADGHTEEYTIFVAAVAHGLMIEGKHEGEMYYVAPQEGFSVQGIVHIATSVDVVVGLLKAMFELKNTIVKSISARPLELLQALALLSSKKVSQYEKSEIIDKKSGEN